MKIVREKRLQNGPPYHCLGLLSANVPQMERAALMKQLQPSGMLR